MDVFEAISSRRSIRSYKSELVPEEKIEKLLEAARLAPSAANRQNWKFVVVNDGEIIKKLVKACNEDDVKRLLKIPQEKKVVALLTVGHPLESPDPRPRKEIGEIITYNEYR